MALLNGIRVSQPSFLRKRRMESFTRPEPPLMMSIGARMRKTNMLPVARAPMPMSSPRKRDPASPMRMTLGFALYQR